MDRRLSSLDGWVARGLNVLPKLERNIVPSSLALTSDGPEEGGR